MNGGRCRGALGILNIFICAAQPKGTPTVEQPERRTTLVRERRVHDLQLLLSANFSGLISLQSMHGLHSSVVRACDCRSQGPGFKSPWGLVDSLHCEFLM